MSYSTPIPFQYLSTLSNRELCDVEETCILNQDTDTLRRIATIRGWRATDNINRIEAQRRQQSGDVWDQQFCR